MAAPAITARGPADDSPVEDGVKDSVEAFLYKVVKRFTRAESAESMNRQNGLDDLRFKKGEQWNDADRASRTIEERPCLTVNKMKTFVHQIVNDQRQNRPAINVSPIGDKADPETAKMLKGLIKQIERTSNADVAYDTGFDSAVSIGWGYWRIVTDYEDEDTFDQVLKILRIRNPFRIYLDPDHEEPDGSDAKWGFISDLVPRTEFKDQWPDAPVMAWEEGGIGDEYKLWATQTHVRVAEYFCFEPTERRLVALSSGHIGFEDELDESIKAEIKANPDLIVKDRTVQAQKVKWYKLTSHSILEEKEWPGKYIPIIKIIGDEVDIEGKVNLAGIIRDAKDPQRMYNYWCTLETELIALAPKAPWIMEEGQAEGHEQRWQQANKKSFPYLLYKGSSVAGKPSPPPQRQQFAGPPAGVVQAKIAAAQDMQATTGIRFDATLQERNYDESGKALKELKRVGEVGNFHYIDNLSRSLRYTGKQLIDLVPKIYDTRRILTILREDGSEERVTIDPNLGKPHEQRQSSDGRIERLFNPKLGDYEVAVTVGPSFATKRAEAADSMLQFLRYVPNAAPVISDLIAKNMDWPGAEEIYTRLQATLPPGLLDKGIDRLPQEARGFVLQLKQQLQQKDMQLKQAAALLGNQDKDRALEKYDIDKQLEGKILKILGDLEKAKMQKGHNPDIEREKISADLDAKVLKIIADHELGKMKLGSSHSLGMDKLASSHELGTDKLASAHELGEGKIASGHMLGEAKNESSERLAKDKQRSSSTGGGSAKSSGSGGGSTDGAVARALEMLAAALAAPRETTLIHDKNGKAIGAVSAPTTTTLQ